jgi:PAS domain S-box-containing protein
MTSKDRQQEQFIEELENLKRHASRFEQVLLDLGPESLASRDGLIRVALDIVPDRLFVKDLEGRYILFNRASSEYWGIPQAEALGHTDFEIHPEGIAEVFAGSDREVFDTGRPLVTEELVVRRDGVSRVLAVMKVPIRSLSGELTGLIGISRDITELKDYRDSIIRQDAILKAVNFAAEHFLRSGLDLTGLKVILANLGNAARVSRVYIHTTEKVENGRIRTSELAEWCAESVRSHQLHTGDDDFVWPEVGMERWSAAMEEGDCILGHVRCFPGAEREVLARRCIQSLVVAPILVDGVWWGFFGLDECAREREWGAGEVEAVKAAANMIGAAVQHGSARTELFQYRDYLQDLVHERTRELERSNSDLRHEIEVRKRTEEKLNMRAAELAALNRLGRKVNATLAHETVAECAVEEIMKALLPDAAVFFLRRGRFLLPLSLSPKGLPVCDEGFSARPIGDCTCGLAASSGEHVYSLDIQRDPRPTCGYFKGSGFRSLASIPLVSDEEVLGVLSMASKVERDFREEEDFIQAFSNQVSIGLRNALLYEQLQWHVKELRRGIQELQRAQEIREELESQLRQVQKMEAIGTLAGGIAHEFNNLLQSVQGYAELILFGKSQSDPDYVRLKAITRAALRGGELTQQLLTFSRKSESRLQRVELSQEVLEANRILERTLPKMIRIEMDLEADLPPVHADPQQIEQILINLALNARDAMPRGGILTIRAEKLDIEKEDVHSLPKLYPGEYVRLSVSDTGHGMENAVVGRIFDPFFTTKEVGKGTGLGLAIVYGIVQNHGGAITCESEPGQGTSFKIYLPVAAGEETPPTPETEVELVGGRETILLVDDEEFLRTLGEQVLGLYGYVVVTAADGDTAISIYERDHTRIDLVILDLIMPGKSGYDCMERFLEINPQVQIIVASGYLEMEGWESDILAKARFIVRKPYEMRDLLQMIRKTLDENGLPHSGE